MPYIEATYFLYKMPSNTGFAGDY